MYKRAMFSTDPDAVYFACRNGVTSNPLYMKCNRCGVADCEIRFYKADWREMEKTARQVEKVTKENTGTTSPLDYVSEPKEKKNSWNYLWKETKKVLFKLLKP